MYKPAAALLQATLVSIYKHSKAWSMESSSPGFTIILILIAIMTLLFSTAKRCS